MKKILIVCALALVLASCSKAGAPVRNVETQTNEDFEVEFLFEVDGVRVFRFNDGGRSRYFTSGNGGYINTLQSTQGGKSTIYWNDGVENR